MKPRALRMLAIILIVVALLGVMFAMNYFADLKGAKAREEAKAVEKAKKAAELNARANNPPQASAHGGPAAFALPKNSGPADAPVKLEVFINNSNTCHQTSITTFANVANVYGKLVRLEWLATNDPKASARADKLKIGCEAGLVIDGKIETQLEKNGGKALVAFRGPAGEKYQMSDVYAVINADLAAKGKKPPAEAAAKAKVVGVAAPQHGLEGKP
jgi:hypothetical protein